MLMLLLEGKLSTKANKQLNNVIAIESLRIKVNSEKKDFFSELTFIRNNSIELMVTEHS